MRLCHFAGSVRIPAPRLAVSPVVPAFAGDSGRARRRPAPPHAEYIRGAVLRLIGGAGEHDRLLRLEVQCEQLADEVQQVARAVIRIGRSLKAARTVST